jgi:uncharacterized protein (TIGR03000 family)
MSRLLLVAVLVAGSAEVAQAQPWHRPHTTSVTWPSVNPPGWYTNTYNHLWFYPWYAYYDFSASPYVGWEQSGGVAGYGYHGPAGYYNYPLGQAAPTIGGPATHAAPVAAPAAEGQVSVTLPADAKLLFNGTAAPGSGAVRTFRVPALQPGQAYRYELTAEVVRDGRSERVTESVIVRAGETAKVTLAAPAVTTASAK